MSPTVFVIQLHSFVVLSFHLTLLINLPFKTLSYPMLHNTNYNAVNLLLIIASVFHRFVIVIFLCVSLYSACILSQFWSLKLESAFSYLHFYHLNLNTSSHLLIFVLLFKKIILFCLQIISKITPQLDTTFSDIVHISFQIILISLDFDCA